jgi:hypothetical protein
MSKPLSLYRDSDPFAPPPDRGRLMTAAEVVATGLIPQGKGERYVRRNVRPRVMLGRTPYWYELDVRRWVDAQREEEAAS